jgi:hypothetical protein
MTTINVQFADSDKAAVIGYASCPQDDSLWPFQGEISTDDPAWKTYYDAQDPVLIQPYLPAPTGGN